MWAEDDVFMVLKCRWGSRHWWEVSQLFSQVQKMNDGGQTQHSILHVGEAVFSWMKMGRDACRTLPWGLQGTGWVAYRSSCSWRLWVHLNAHLPFSTSQDPYNNTHAPLSVSVSGTRQGRWSVCLQHGLLNIFNPLWRSTARREDASFRK